MHELQRMKQLILAISICLFTCQMWTAWQKYQSEPTMVSKGTKRLFDLNKPLLLTVCKLDQFDPDKASQLGYSSFTDFVAGEIASNKSVLSWNGLDDGLTPNETMNTIFKSEMVHVKRGFVNSTMRFILPYGFCQVAVGPTPDIIHKGTNDILIEIKKPGQYTVYISDQALSTPHQINSLMSGTRVKIHTQTGSYIREYFRVHLKEENLLDTNKDCTAYPDKSGHVSYAQCIEEENRSKMLPLVGCLAPWMSNKDQCTGKTSLK